MGAILASTKIAGPAIGGTLSDDAAPPGCSAQGGVSETVQGFFTQGQFFDFLHNAPSRLLTAVEEKLYRSPTRVQKAIVDISLEFREDAL